MSNMLSTIFSLGDDDVTVRSVVAPDGTPWFCAADVAKAAGYKDVRQALQSHAPKRRNLDSILETEALENRGGVEIPPLSVATLFGKNNWRQTAMLDEPMIYKLLMRGRAPKADMFVDWLSNEVLPSIRGTGRYEVAKLTEVQWAEKYLAIAREREIVERRNVQLAIEVAERSTRLAQGTHMTMKQLREACSWMPTCDWRELTEISKELGHEVLRYGTDGATSQNQPAMYHREVCYDYAAHRWEYFAKYRPQRLIGHDHPALYFGVEMPI